METATPKETIFYQDAAVTVTRSRFITESKTYAVRNISSVHVFEVARSKKIPFLAIICGGLLALSADLRVGGFCFIAIGLSLLIFLKNNYAVRISTNSGEANSLVSKDRAYVVQIVDALNDAIIHQG